MTKGFFESECPSEQVVKMQEIYTQKAYDDAIKDLLHLRDLCVLTQQEVKDIDKILGAAKKRWDERGGTDGSKED